MIPEDVIAEVKKRADIGAVIGRSVKLKRAGRNLVGLCPFHNEKSPSFNVRPDEGFFYCFGCKAAGDVVEFVVRSTGRGFLDVITELAAETGVVLPQVELSAEETAAQKEKKRLVRVCELAQVFFRTRLTGDDGRAARAYLKDVRKLDDAAVDAFGLGFGGGADKGLRDFLVGQGVSVDDGVAAGVLGRGERGEYDFFRHRITIPIRSTRGEAIAFGGRIFGELAEGRPKYLNGPQTAIYDKSSVLYGLYEAQPALKQGKPAVLVEGYFDAIAIHRAGLATAVAPCGTSLTMRHVEELKRRTERSRVIVCLDADKAGQEAAAKAILMFLQNDVDTGFVVLPDKDPDQMVQAGRLDELRGMLVGAPSALDFLVKRAQEKATGSMQARVQAIDSLLPFLAAPARELIRKEAVRAAARAFGEAEDVLEREVHARGRKLLGERLRGERSAARPSSTNSTSTPATRPSSTTSPATSTTSAATSAARAARRDPPTATTTTLRAKKPAPPSPPMNDLEVQLAKIVLCHPELGPRVALLAPRIEHKELKRFVDGVVDALVRLHDLAPRDALAKVPVAPRGKLIALADRVRLDGPDRTLGLQTAMSMLESISQDLLQRSELEERLGRLQSALSRADESSDHVERKRLLVEQRALVTAMQALDGHVERRPLAGAVDKLVEQLPTANFMKALPPSAPATTTATSTESTPTSTSTSLPAPTSTSTLPQPAPPPDDMGDPPWAGDPDDDPWAV